METSHSEIIESLPEQIEGMILWIRGQKVMLDADLAKVYGVTTKRLNQQVRRNWDRFPPDFMFQLTQEEKDEVVAKCNLLKNIRYSNTLPLVFTEHGAVMLASILNSPIAVQASIHVVRAFVRLREILATHKDLALKLEEMEKKYDSQFQVVFSAIRQLMEPPRKETRKIGFLNE
jgi:ORF6N domain.